MSDFLLMVLAIGILFLTVAFAVTSDVPEYRDCDGYSQWQSRFVPARCFVNFDPSL